MIQMINGLNRYDIENFTQIFRQILFVYANKNKDVNKKLKNYLKNTCNLSDIYDIIQIYYSICQITIKCLENGNGLSEIPSQKEGEIAASVHSLQKKEKEVLEMQIGSLKLLKICCELNPYFLLDHIYILESYLSLWNFNANFKELSYQYLSLLIDIFIKISQFLYIKKKMI